MLDGMRMATEGMMNMSVKQELVANNLANAGTVGFRKESLVVESFTDIMAREANGKGEISATGGLENRSGVRTSSLTHVGQGALKETGNAFDLALNDNGQGYFTLQGEDGGIRFSRAGQFKLHNSGHLVTSDGSFVMGHRGPIKISGGDFKVEDNGVISVNGREIDRLLISRIEDPKAIIRNSGSSFSVSHPDAAVATTDFKVAQGYLEQANFNALTEMVDLMQTMRNFEANQKALQSHDQRLQKAVNELGRVR